MPEIRALGWLTLSHPTTVVPVAEVDRRLRSTISSTATRAKAEPMSVERGDGMQITGHKPQERTEPCRHDSTRIDGTLDCHCLRCGVDGYWHEGHRHDHDHPSGKVLLDLRCHA